MVEAKTLREWRADKFWTQQDLARRARVSDVTISNFENARRPPRASTIRALARALRIRPEQIKLSDAGASVAA